MDTKFEPKKRSFTLCESMEMALIFRAEELDVDPECLLDSILFMFFWSSDTLYKAIVECKLKEIKK